MSQLRRGGLIALLLIVSSTPLAHADNTFWSLATQQYAQTWANPNLITLNDDWSGVPSVMGYRGDDPSAGLDIDPQTVLQDLSGIVDVHANLPIPDPFLFGGVGDFDILSDPCVGLQPDASADFPNIVFYMNTVGLTNVLFHYQIRDIDGSPDNSVQQVALQYRLGGVGNYVNVPAGYIPDATIPNALFNQPAFNISLPAWDNQPMLELRILTTNATGANEWIGVDKIEIHGVPIPEPTGASLLALGALLIGRRR